MEPRIDKEILIDEFLKFRYSFLKKYRKKRRLK